jgi:hypothetical protein
MTHAEGEARDTDLKGEERYLPELIKVEHGYLIQWLAWGGVISLGRCIGLGLGA